MYRLYGSRIPLPAIRTGQDSEELFLPDLERIADAAAELFARTYAGKKPTLTVADVRRELISPLNDIAQRIMAERGKLSRYTPPADEEKPITPHEIAFRGKLRGTPLGPYLKMTIEALLRRQGYTYSRPTYEGPGLYCPPKGDPLSIHHHLGRGHFPRVPDVVDSGGD